MRCLTGRELYLDRFGEPTFTWDSRDLTACGVAEPKYQGNLSTMFRYKGFSANLSFGYRFGGQLYNSTLIEKVENTDFRENVDARVYKGRWQKAGDIAAFKGLHLKDKTSKTSRFVENTISFRFPPFEKNSGYGESDTECQYLRSFLYFVGKEGKGNSLSFFTAIFLFIECNFLK